MRESFKVAASTAVEVARSGPHSVDSVQVLQVAPKSTEPFPPRAPGGN